MSGSYGDYSVTAVDAAAIAAGVNAAIAATNAAQAASGRFIVEHGALGAGHAQVTGPAGS